jgi:hypothetical protein
VALVANPKGLFSEQKMALGPRATGFLLAAK